MQIEAPELTMISYCAKTDVGRVRSHNEDNFLVDEELGLFVIADGMGGYECGDVASEIVIKSIQAEIMKKSSLHESVRKSHHAVLNAIDHGIGKQGMGSTVVSAIFDGNNFEVAWVGDSRAYLWNGALTQVSKDHSLVQRLIDAGVISYEESLVHPERNVISQALGFAGIQDVQVDVATGCLKAGEALLLCSDGLTSEVSDQEIMNILSFSSNANDDVNRLIQASLQNGGGDNVTVIMILAPNDGGSQPTQGLRKKIFRWFGNK